MIINKILLTHLKKIFSMETIQKKDNMNLG